MWSAGSFPTGSGSRRLESGPDVGCEVPDDSRNTVGEGGLRAIPADFTVCDCAAFASSKADKLRIFPRAVAGRKSTPPRKTCNPRPEGGDRDNVNAVGARVGLRTAGHHEEQVGAGQVYFRFLGCSILYSWGKWLFILGNHWVWPDGVNSRRRGNRTERRLRRRLAFFRDGTGRFRVEWRAVADAAPFGA